jgi:hypothetical protein
MFLVGDTPEVQARKIKGWLATDASVSLLVAATYFEWALCRSLIALSLRPNASVRRDMARVFGLDRYKKFWLSEIQHLGNGCRLPEIVKNWKGITDAFEARNRLVHGRDRYTRKMALPHVEHLLQGALDLRTYCLTHGYDIFKRLPVRRKDALPRI